MKPTRLVGTRLRVSTRFNPIGLSQRDAAAVLPSRVFRHIGTNIDNGAVGRLFIFQAIRVIEHYPSLNDSDAFRVIVQPKNAHERDAWKACCQHLVALKEAY